MTVELIPQLYAANVVNLPQEYAADWQAMITQWQQKLDRNILRTQYYDGKNRIKNLDIAVPNSMAKISEVVGWPQKAVDALANRVRFDGFVSSGVNRNPLGLDDILEANDFAVTLPQAVRSGLTLCCAFCNVRQKEPTDHVDAPVVVSFRSALYETGLWSYADHGLRAALSITEIDVDKYAREQQAIPSEIMLYEPGQTIRIVRRLNGTYVAEDPQPTNLDHVPVYVLPYHQDLNQPFGRSRINREVMSITDTAVRTMLRMEISAEFYSSPQRALLGGDPPVDKNGKKLTGWEAAITHMLTVSRDENGDLPTIQQFAQMTMQPHTDMLRALAARMSGATGVPMAQFGVMTDSGPSSADAIEASETELVIEARNTCDAFGSQLRRAAKDMAVLAGHTVDAQELRTLKVNWKNPERPSMSAQSDAILKQVQALPWLADSPVILEQLGYDDATVSRLLSDKSRAQSGSVLDRLLNAGDDADSSEEKSTVEVRESTETRRELSET